MGTILFRLPAGMQQFSSGPDSKEFVRKTLTRTEGSPNATRSADPPGEVVPCQEEAPIELMWSDGTRIIRRVGEIEREQVVAGDAGVPSPVSIAREGLSGGLSRVIIHALAGEVARVAVDRFDDNRVAKGSIVRIAASGAVSPVDKVDSYDTALVLIHGTFSKTDEAFGKLFASPVWQDLHYEYHGRCFGLDHRTLSRSPIDNALQLVEGLPEGVTVDLLTHSRGGLVADVLAAAASPSEPSADQLVDGQAALAQAFVDLSEVVRRKNIKVRRTVRVAAPARGTTLASGRLDTWLNVAMNVFGLATGFCASPVYEAIRLLLLAVVRERSGFDVVPGIASMVPDGAFLRWLQQLNASDRLTVIAGDASRTGLLGRLRTVIPDLFFLQANDLVVDTAAMGGGAQRAKAPILLPFRDKPESPIHHLIYFQNRQVVEAVAAALVKAPKAEDSDVATPSMAARGWVGTAWDGIGGGTLEPRLRPASATVLLIPGILGSALGVPGTPIWPVIPRLAQGRFTELSLQNPKVEEMGVLRGPYARLVEFLSRRFDVQPFDYDWRKSVYVAADKLAKRIAEIPSGAHIHVIAHSLGGLVVSALAVQNETSFRRLTQNGRILFLGTPHHGSWAIVRLLLGQEELLLQLARLDVVHDQAQLLALIRQFDGILDLLPEEGDDAPLGEATSGVAKTSVPWSQVLGVSQRALDEARERRASVSKARDRFKAELKDASLYVAGMSYRTPCRVAADGSESSIGQGDGRVTWASAWNDGIPMYLMDAEHGSLADTPHAFPALQELIETGVTSRLRLMSRSLATSGLLSCFGSSRSREAAQSVRSDPKRTRDLLPNEAELVDSAVGRTTGRVQRALRVEVFHGELLSERDVVVVGHASHDILRGPEPWLDAVLDGALSKRLRIGRYPSTIGSCAVVPGKRESGTTPAAVLVVGLGAGEALTRALLTEALRSSLLELSVAEDNGSGSISAEAIALTPIGSTTGPLTVAESVGAALDAILLCNRTLVAEGQEERCIRRVRFVDIFAQAAEEIRDICWSYARRPGVETDHAEVVLGPERVQSHPGQASWLPERPRRVHSRARVRRVSILKRPGPGPDVFDFGVAGDGSSFSQRSQVICFGVVDEHARDIATNPAYRADAVKTLLSYTVPTDLQEHFTSGTDLQLIVDDVTSSLPWEAFVHSGTDDNAPLTASISILRQLAEPTPPLPPSLGSAGRVLLLSSPGTGALQLSGAEKEIETLQTMFFQRGFRVETERRNAHEMRLALAHPCEIVHIAGHGQHTRGNPCRTGVLVPGEGTLDVLTAMDLRVLAKSPPALVFLSCCHLGAMDPSSLDIPSEFAAGLARALVRDGVSAVVAAGWAVQDDAACHFATRLYDQLLEGEPLRNAVANARLDARERDPSLATWAAYQVYGDPDFVLPSIRSRAANLETDLDSALSTPVWSEREALDVLSDLMRRKILFRDSLVLAGRAQRFVEALPKDARTPKVDELLQLILRSTQASQAQPARYAPPPSALTTEGPGGAATETSASALEILPSPQADAEPGPIDPSRAPSDQAIAEYFQEAASILGEREAPDAPGRAVQRAYRALNIYVFNALSREPFGTQRYVSAQEVAARFEAALGGGARPDMRAHAQRRLWRAFRVLDPSLTRSALPKLKELIAELQARVPELLDDPNKGKYGLLSEVGGYVLSATVEPAERQRSVAWFRICLRLDWAEDANPQGVTFYLHPTFYRPVRRVALTGQHFAALELLAYGAFTVGAEIVCSELETPTTLELDLALVPGAPAEFINDARSE